MKLTVTIIRILTGALFIFSGLVKAIDPLGLAYKMQEFFEAWANAGIMKGLMSAFDKYAVSFSIIMITLEVAVGLALLLGWKKKLTTWILLLLMLFFTFLTSYVLFSGKIRACGCFGDCIPLTPIQTFTKDIILLLFVIFLLINTKYITPVLKPLSNTLAVVLGIALTLYLQFHVLKHLPLKDCLPYKVGNNILELRKMPADAVPDVFDYNFVYEKDGTKKNFTVASLPDSSWKFVERKQVLVSPGKNNIPLINDFSLTDEDGIKVTDSVLNTKGKYYLFFVKELTVDTAQWRKKFFQLNEKAQQEGTKVYVITAQQQAVYDYLQDHKIFTNGVLSSDGIAIKTAARVNPTLFVMEGPVVKNKLSWRDMKNN
ncbi:BT_3928 family protein [Ferruginibacter sp. HRS2-29]|uniref:BT_3928 family protein n=1 Tax=Ferruginibacter sp. HRS2-29 TaxID=2487334 RepID=UPI0020CC4B87|nr:BT_3928 family protein [Ferruginibacter sp. HRS2-29]MCP9750069.1 DoxX family membrane protein [Ferruginibacter sp. HRS2-29]